MAKSKHIPHNRNRDHNDWRKGNLPAAGKNDNTHPPPKKGKK